MVHTFPKGICPKGDVLARLERELAYYDFVIQRFNHYTMGTSPLSFCFPLFSLCCQLEQQNPLDGKFFSFLLFLISTGSGLMTATILGNWRVHTRCLCGCYWRLNANESQISKSLFHIPVDSKPAVMLKFST